MKIGTHPSTCSVGIKNENLAKKPTYPIQNLSTDSIVLVLPFSFIGCHFIN